MIHTYHCKFNINSLINEKSYSLKKKKILGKEESIKYNHIFRADHVNYFGGFEQSD